MFPDRIHHPRDGHPQRPVGKVECVSDTPHAIVLLSRRPLRISLVAQAYYFTGDGTHADIAARLWIFNFPARHSVHQNISIRKILRTCKWKSAAFYLEIPSGQEKIRSIGKGLYLADIISKRQLRKHRLKTIRSKIISDILLPAVSFEQLFFEQLVVFNPAQKFAPTDDNNLLTPRMNREYILQIVPAPRVKSGITSSSRQTQRCST